MDFHCFLSVFIQFYTLFVYISDKIIIFFYKIPAFLFFFLLFLIFLDISYI